MILPTPAAEFEWRDFGGRSGLVCRPLERAAAHLFTTADWPTGAARPTGDAPEAWPAIARALGVAPFALTRLRQVHGTDVAIAGQQLQGAPLPEADIVLVGGAGRAGAVQVADCVPILLADAARGTVAAAHAGWRGLAAGVPRIAIDAMRKRFGTRPADIIAALGPSIGACCYEVGPDVRQAFTAAGFDAVTLNRWFFDAPSVIAGNSSMARVRRAASRSDHWFFDGWTSARDQLVRGGVPAGSVFGAALCTASHPDVFCSYRRDGAPAGRLVGAIRSGAYRPEGTAGDSAVPG